MNRRTAIGLGIPSGLVILGGLLELVLIHVLMSMIGGTYIKDQQYFYDEAPEYARWPLWVIGFGYIIPGFFGLLSALIQNKGLYVVSLVLTIVLLIIMGGVTIFVCLLIFAFSRDSAWYYAIEEGDCYDVGEVCVCRQDYFNPTLHRGCSSYKAIYSLSVAVSFFLVFTWVSQLVLFILFCYYTCCAQRGGFQGVVITTNQQQQPVMTIVLDQNTSSESAQALPTTNLPSGQSLDQTTSVVMAGA